MRMYLNLDMRLYYCRWFHVVDLPRFEEKNWGLEDDLPVSSYLPGRIYVKFRDLHQQPSGPNASNTSNVSNETMMPEAGSNKKYLKDVLRKLVLVFFFCFFFWVSQDGSLGTLRQIISCHINCLAGGPRLLRCLGVFSYQQNAQALPANVLARYPYATGAAAHVLGCMWGCHLYQWIGRQQASPLWFSQSQP